MRRLIVTTMYNKLGCMYLKASRANDVRVTNICNFCQSFVISLILMTKDRHVQKRGIQ